MAVRPRFSLRLLLIAFTLVAILFGGAAQVVWRVKNQVHRHKAAIAKFDQKKWSRDRYPDPGDAPKGSFAEFARTWIDQDAYSPSKVILRSERLTHSEAIQFLTTAQDIYGVETIQLNVDLLTADMIPLINGHSSLCDLVLEAKSIDPEVVALLPTLKALRWIGIDDPIDDETAKTLGSMEQIKYIELDVSALTVEGSRHLENLRNLGYFQLHGKIDSPDALACLVRDQKFQRLWFENCDLGDTVLSALKLGESIEAIEFRGCKLPSTMTKQLSQVKGLKKLGIQTSNPLEVESLAEFATYPALESLKVYSPGIRGLGSLQWRPPPTLKHLSYSDKDTDDAMVAFLKHALDCEITVVVKHDQEGRAFGRSITLVNGMLVISEYKVLY